MLVPPGLLDHQLPEGPDSHLAHFVCFQIDSSRP